MHIKIIFLLSWILLLNSNHLHAQEPGKTNKNWRLVWRDEFNGAHLDTSKWNVLIRENSKHGELQYYVPDEVYVENGILKIRTRKRNYGSREYTSGRLDTRSRFSTNCQGDKGYGPLTGFTRRNATGLWKKQWRMPSLQERKDLSRRKGPGIRRLISWSSLVMK